MPQNYAIVCAPSGTGLRKSLAKLQNSSKDIEIRDIEDIICESRQTAEALTAVGFGGGSSGSRKPKMYDLTWNLSRSQIIDLWNVAARDALHQLNQSSKKVKILSCHLTYYGGRRGEFYSPINASLLANQHLKPSHILLFIDDVYDMYLRLTDRNGLFNPADRMPMLQGRIREDEGLDIKTLPPDELACLCFEWQTGILTHLLAWRHLEIIIAETLAVQLKSNFLVWGIKQLTSATISWLKNNEPKSIYLSHPISRPRRIFRKTKNWHEVVNQFNTLQDRLLDHGLICVMPSAIDEYRIEKKQGRRALPNRRPNLEARWPLPSTFDSILYTLPRETKNINHESLLNLKRWDFDAGRFFDLENIPESLYEKSDIFLRSFERQIELQISSRDHLFVSWTKGILIFRPLFKEGVWSSGVKAETSHWELIARSEKDKRAAFLHLDEDVKVMLKYHAADDKRAEVMRHEKKDELTEIIRSKFDLSDSNAQFAINFIEEYQHSELLDQGRIPPKRLSEISNYYSEAIMKADKNWLFKKLGGYDIISEEIGENQIGVWVIPDYGEFTNEIVQISDFFKNGTLPSNNWLDRF